MCLFEINLEMAHFLLSFIFYFFTKIFTKKYPQARRAGANSKVNIYVSAVARHV